MRNQRTVITICIAGCASLLVLALLGRPEDFWLTPDQQGERLMVDQDYQAAAEVYDDPLRQGVAYFRGGDFESAAGTFARVDEPESAFDRGNALIMLGQYDEAIESYDRALQFKPDWSEAKDNRSIAVARRDRMQPPEDDGSGTDGMLGADEIVFDDRAQNNSQTEQVEVGSGDAMSDDELRALWLQRVQTKPADFLRAKFAYQLARQGPEKETQE